MAFNGNVTVLPTYQSHTGEGMTHATFDWLVLITFIIWVGA